MSVTSEHVSAPADAGSGLSLATFYDRRAPAALAYCARVCPPEAIAGAVEASFARAFAGGIPASADELEARLRSALRAEAAHRCIPRDDEGDRRFARVSLCARTSRLIVARAAGELSDAELEPLAPHLYTCPDCRALERRFDEAERTFDALAGTDAPALGRPLVAELAARLEPAQVDGPPRDQRAALPDRRPDPGSVAIPQPPPPRPAGMRPAVAPALRRARRVLPRLGPVARRRAAITLFVIGVLLLAEVAVTALWGEPLTAYLTSNAQAELSKQLGALDRASGAKRGRVAGVRDAGRRMSLLAADESRTTAAGNALGDMRIPRMAIDFVVVQGTDAPALRKGPGHYRDTALPGEGGTVGIAGHRTTYEAPFRDVDRLKPGDRVILKMPYGLFVYSVTGHRIVPASAPLFSSAAGERLILSACHPLFSATHRILVYAKLVSAQPLGAAVPPAGGEPRASGPSTSTGAQKGMAARLAALGGRELQYGTRGPDVKELQILLGVPPSSFFGNDTLAAVMAFQKAHGLPSDGHVGSRTKQALARRTHPPSVPPTPASVAPAPPGTTTPQIPTTTGPSH